MKFTGEHSERSFQPAAGTGRVTALSPCPRCRRPDAQDILSRHQTEDGLLIYTRCRCGALHLWLWPYEAGTAEHVAHGRPFSPADGNR